MVSWRVDVELPIGHFETAVVDQIYAFSFAFPFQLAP